MSNNMLHDLARQLRSRRIDRRTFLRDAAVIGASATAISSALRAAPVARAQDAGKVVFWTSHTEPDLTTLRLIVDTFNQENADIRVELTPVVGDETDVTKLMTAVRGGTGPDIYHLDRFNVAQRAADGVLQELDEYLEGEDISETHIAFAAAEAKYQGKTYALPTDTDARALFFNRGMLQEVGIDPAELDPAKPITFARFAEIANQLNQTDQDGNYSRMGFAAYTDQAWHYTYGFAFGGKFFNEETCEVTPGDPGVVAGHQWLYDYVKALDPQKVNAFAGPVAADQTVPEEQQVFVAKRTAFAITGDWYLGVLPEYAPDIDFGLTLIPVPKEGDQSATWAGGWSVVIPQGAKNVEGAARFIRYIGGEPGQRTYATETKHLPTVKTLLQDTSLFGEDEQHRFFAETLLPTAKNRPPLPVGVKYWNELTAAWQKIYLNEEEPADALATVKDRVQGDLEAYCPIETS